MSAAPPLLSSACVDKQYRAWHCHHRLESPDPYGLRGFVLFETTPSNRDRRFPMKHMILTVVVLASVLVSGCYSYTRTNDRGEVVEEATGILASPGPVVAHSYPSPCRRGFAYDQYANRCIGQVDPRVNYRPDNMRVYRAGYRYNYGYGYYYRPHYRHHRHHRHHRVVRTTRVVHRPKVVRHSPRPRPRHSDRPRRARPRR